MHVCVNSVIFYILLNYLILPRFQITLSIAEIFGYCIMYHILIGYKLLIIMDQLKTFQVLYATGIVAILDKIKNS